MLLDEIKAAFKAAMKARNTLEKEILRTALGDISSRGGSESDADVQAVLRKLVKSNEESLGNATDEEQKATLEQELLILNRFLPQLPGPEQLAELLAPVADAIRAAGGDGQATGVAMKHLKGAGITANGKDVAAAAKALRA